VFALVAATVLACVDMPASQPSSSKPVMQVRPATAAMRQLTFFVPPGDAKLEGWDAECHGAGWNRGGSEVCLPEGERARFRDLVSQGLEQAGAKVVRNRLEPYDLALDTTVYVGYLSSSGAVSPWESDLTDGEGVETVAIYAYVVDFGFPQVVEGLRKNDSGGWQKRRFDGKPPPALSQRFGYGPACHVRKDTTQTGYRIGRSQSEGPDAAKVAAFVVDDLMTCDSLEELAVALVPNTAPAPSPVAALPPAASSEPAPPSVAPIADGKRRALVIGNGAYAASPLSNPPNDARLVAETLRALAFEVELQVNADQRTMKRAINDFGQRLPDGGVALFYFAGHGVQFRGNNYLIPLGVQIQSAADIDVEAIRADSVLAKLEAGRTRLNIVVLDACRNNPFKAAERDVGRGLAFVSAPVGTLVAYATAPGDVALDGRTGNSPYTRSLARRMREGGLEMGQMFKAVMRDVRDETSGKQVPWVSSSVSSDFYFMNRQ
jgi:hypothetical protein